MSMRETKVPDIPPIPSGVDPAVSAWMKAVTEVLQVRGGQRGDPLDRAVTLRDLVASGIASAAGGGLASAATSGSVAPRGAGPRLTQLPSPSDLAPAPAATGFTLSVGEETFLLEWATPTYKTGGGHAYTEVWMAAHDGVGDPPTISDAVVLDRVPASIYAHTPGSGVTAHFWVRHVTRNGVAQAAPTGGTNGLSGTTGPGGDVLDELKLGRLRVASLVAGDGTISGILRSANYTGGSLGWRIGRDGDVEFNDATLRGVIYAGAGLIGGNVIAEDGIEAPYWTSGGYGWRLGSDGIIKARSAGGTRIFDLGAAGTDPVLKIGAALVVRADGTATFTGSLSSSEVMGGDFTSWDWPASGDGFYLGSSGLRLGNCDSGGYFDVRANGDMYTPAFKVEGGVMTVMQANVIKAINLAGGAVNASASDSGTGASISASITIPAGTTWRVLCLGFQNGFTTAPPYTTHSLTLEGATSELLAITLNIGPDGAEYVTYVQAGVIATVATVSAPPGSSSTFTPSLAGNDGISKTIVLFGAPA